MGIVITSESKNEFYPTSEELANELLAGYQWSSYVSVLEPSAGKGDIVKMVLEKAELRYVHSYEVDCVEIDPYLRAILQANFADRDNVYIVGDDFLQMDSKKSYDLIVMNPPFSNGELHLLKAISMIQPYGGEIRCILNAETIRNPYSRSRQMLQERLSELKADISYKSNAFAYSERRTNVEIAIIKIHVDKPKYENNPESLYNRMKKASFVESTVTPVTDLTVKDQITRIVAQFNFEADAGIRLMKEYAAMQPYIQNEFATDESIYRHSLIELKVDNRSISIKDKLPVNEYLKKVRYKYWKALLSNEKFTSLLTNDLREKYQDMITNLSNYDFTIFNIEKLITEMNSEMIQGVQDCILKLFDEMTIKHTWFPEMEKNILWFTGWKTNKAHKISFPKVIIPCYNIFNSYSWNKDTFDLRAAYYFLADIEKVLNYLDGNVTASVDLYSVLTSAHDQGITKNIECKYFSVTFYKKGTVHIRFHSQQQQLIDRFNIYCCQKKGWLPPDYGTHKYNDMNTEAQQVIDSFHGTGEVGSGEKKYADIISQSSYFLADPGMNAITMPLLN